MARTNGKKRWSGEVTRHSNALNLRPAIFKSGSPRRIAIPLRHSAEASKRRNGTPLQSAVSMLNFYINRAGGNLSAKQKNVLTHAKEELRREFGRA